MKKLSFILFLVMLASFAQARLNETPAEITARYGTMLNAPTIMGTNLWIGHFRHAGFEIDVTFWKGKCVKEYFQVDDLFSEDAARTMFSSVTGEGKITTDRLPIKDDDCSMVNFENLATGATGQYYRRGIDVGTLTVEDKRYRDFEARQSADENKKKLAGF